MRICHRIVGAVAIVLSVSAIASAWAADTRLPVGVQPVDTPVLIRCGPVERFQYEQNTVMKVAGQPEQALSYVEMAGSVVRDGADLRSEIYYIDFNGLNSEQRGPFTLDVLFSDIGEPLSIEIRPLEEGPMFTPMPGSAEYKDLVNEFEVNMALQTLPVEPVATGDAVYDLDTLFRHSFEPEQLATMRWVSSDLASTLAGTADIDGRSYLVIEHSGSVVFETGGQQTRARASGYWTMDSETCMSGDGILRFVMTFTQNEDAPFMVIETVTEAD